MLTINLSEKFDSIIIPILIKKKNSDLEEGSEG